MFRTHLIKSSPHPEPTELHAGSLATTADDYVAVPCYVAGSRYLLAFEIWAPQAT